MSFKLTDLDLEETSKEQLLEMLQSKVLENVDLYQQIAELNLQLANKQAEMADLRLKTSKIYEENQKIKIDPELAKDMARMDYELSMAAKFIKGKAFSCENPEQAYVLIKAGAEMGLKPIESMQLLYIVKGAVKPYGDKMAAMILKQGYKIEYLNETTSGVDVRIYHPNPDVKFDVTERVLASDKAVNSGRAYGFSPKNKMRFHGIRMFVSFHLAHLFSSVQDEFTSQFLETTIQDENQNTAIIVKNEDVLQLIEGAESLEELDKLYSDNKATISKNINLASALGAKKKQFQQ